ncbi:hypothetical protein HNP90_000495 [Methanococcus maripaludis]|uniref:Uncharacterized protein n=1 Tax=Methanococcus maripaludis TaxID=39152 RepID=A0A7J9PEF8_METMI|nr:hypothetical protein [Methanococcus maripaludis]
MINWLIDPENIPIKDDNPKINNPFNKIRFLPIISAILPTGSKNAELASRNEVTIHPKMMVSAENSVPILGRARFNAVLIKGVKNDEIAATIATMDFSFRI